MFRNFVRPGPVRAACGTCARGSSIRATRASCTTRRMQVDTTGTSRRYDEQIRSAGYEGLVAPSARAPDGFFLDWAPGHRPTVAVPGTAWPLPASSDLVMMLHLRPSGKVEQVQASLALYFSDGPAGRGCRSCCV